MECSSSSSQALKMASLDPFDAMEGSSRPMNDGRFLFALPKTNTLFIPPFLFPTHTNEPCLQHTSRIPCYSATEGGSRDSPVSDDGVPRSGSFGRGGLNVTQRDLPSVPGIPSSDDSYTSMATKGIGLEILEQAEEPTHPPTVAELEESVTWKDLGIYFLRQVLAQIQAVVPVSLYFTVFLALVFRQPLTNVLSIIGGLLLVIIGLTFFLEGLKIFFMPLSERIGWKLPLKFPLPPVLGVLTVLGILCTYAEPALNALVPLGELVVPAEAPYLYENTQKHCFSGLE